MRAGGTLAGRACCSWQWLLLKGHICAIMRRAGQQALCPDVQKVLIHRAVSMSKSTLQSMQREEEQGGLLSAGNRTSLPTSSFSTWFYASQGWLAADISLGVLLNIMHLHRKQSVACMAFKLQYLSGYMGFVTVFCRGTQRAWLVLFLQNVSMTPGLRFVVLSGTGRNYPCWSKLQIHKHTSCTHG